MLPWFRGFVPAWNSARVLAGTDECTKIPDTAAAWSVRSLWLTADRAPDDTAVAIYKRLWFSSAEIPAQA